MINKLAYVVVSTQRLAEWRELATQLVGLHEVQVEAGRAVRLRMDGKAQRLLLVATEDAPSLAMGFEVQDGDQLGITCDELAAAGITIAQGSPSEIELRAVEDMVHCCDADGNRIEISWGLREAREPLVPGRPIGGFRTGDLGIGHVALKAGHYREMCALYRDVLHFRLSDRATAPFEVEFYHVNARHHTLGLADTGTGAGVYHLMLEYNDWDDVGRAHDMALERPDAIGVTLGRHSNDHVTSFYLVTPDGWMLELGWAGRLIDSDWKVADLPGLSLWGHERTWLPPAKREQAKAQLRALAAQGLRAPVALPREKGDCS